MQQKMQNRGLLCVALLAVMIGGKDCKVQPPQPQPSPSPTVSASPISSPSPLPSISPAPVDPCASTTCPEGTRCAVEESLPPKAVCVPLPSPSPSSTPTPVPSASPSASPSPVVSPVACDQPTREPRPSLGRQGNVLASQVCERGSNGDSPDWKINNELVPHDAGAISVMVKRMLEDGSGGYAVFRDGVLSGAAMDYWGRIYGCWPPRAGCLLHDYSDGYASICPPPPCAQPTPSASTPPPSTPPPPPSGDDLVPCEAFPALLCPKTGTCPVSWDYGPSRVGVGDKPDFNKQSPSRSKLTFHLSSKSQPPLCAHRGNQGECEQWTPCGVKQDKAGYPPVVWYAAYPDTTCNMGSVNVQECQIEHASRLCDAEEKADDAAHGLDPNACRRPNGWALTDIVGENGGPPGLRTVCAAPPTIPRARALAYHHEEWTRTKNGGFTRLVRRRMLGDRPLKMGAPSCHTWDVTLNGARLIQ